jgi:hypothetical protein
VPDWAEFDASYRRREATLRRLDARAEPGALVFVGETTRRVVQRSAITGASRPRGPSSSTSGVNDVGLRPVERFEHIYRDIVAKVPAHVPPVLSEMLPVDGRTRPGGINRERPGYDDVIRAICRERPGCTLADAGARLADDSGNLAVRYRTGDGLHLNREGYEARIGALRPALAPYAG